MLAEAKRFYRSYVSKTAFAHTVERTATTEGVEEESGCGRRVVAVQPAAAATARNAEDALLVHWEATKERVSVSLESLWGARRSGGETTSRIPAHQPACVITLLQRVCSGIKAVLLCRILNKL